MFPRANRPRLLSFWPYIAFSIVALIHWGNVIRFAVDVPHWDEWELLRGLIRVRDQHDWTWLFERANEHLLVLTKLQITFSYFWNHWDIRLLQILNFPIFLAILVFFWIVVTRSFPSRPRELLFFLLFPLAPLAWENHTMSSQSCLHLVLLLTGLSGWLLFQDRPRWRCLILAFLTSLLAVLTFANGVVGTAALCVIYSLRKVIQFIDEREFRKQHLAELTFVLASHAAMYWLFFHLTGLSGDPGGAKGFFSLSVWHYFFSLFVFGYGFDSLRGLYAYSFLLGPALIGFLFYPFWANRKKLASPQWILLGWTAAILATVLVIAKGRHLQGIEGSRSSRYFEFVMMLPPLTAVIWSFFLTSQPKLRKKVLIGFGLFVFLAFANNWTFHSYRLTQERKLAVLACINDLRNHRRTDPVCKNASPFPLSPYLKEAEILNLSFLRQLEGQTP